ncbi:MAG TPA: ABC transporter permease, partial [Mycobacterium sp.]|nr:ABC transporter permease [Mycobacterium sp.]
MTASTGLTEYVSSQVKPALTMVGGFARMCTLTGKALFRGPFQWRELIL